MAFTQIDFASMPWAQGGHPLEQKKVHAGSHSTLLRFAPGFADPNWCTSGHVLFVLEGSLMLQFEQETLTLHQGQACQIDAGTAHRASNPGVVDAVLFALTAIAPNTIALNARQQEP